MSIYLRCSCGVALQVPYEFAGRRGECPVCGNDLEIPNTPSVEQASAEVVAAEPASGSVPGAMPFTIVHFLDPPTPHQNETDASTQQKSIIWHRMLEALLDPRSIQWMLMIGGGLCVLGSIVWLVSKGVFENPRVLAVALGTGTLAILGAGWFVALRTKYRIAGRRLRSWDVSWHR